MKPIINPNKPAIRPFQVSPEAIVAITEMPNNITTMSSTLCM